MPLYSLNGRRPSLPPEGSFWIAPNACVIGDVVIGRDVGIWFGAVLRGDNEPIVIGARTNIQDGTIVHVDRDVVAGAGLPHRQHHPVGVRRLPRSPGVAQAVASHGDQVAQDGARGRGTAGAGTVAVSGLPVTGSPSWWPTVR